MKSSNGRLSLNENLLAVGGLLMLVASFLPWHTATRVGSPLAALRRGDPVRSTEVATTGWESPTAPWSLLAVLIAVTIVIALVTRPGMGVGNIQARHAYLIGSATVVLMLVIPLTSRGLSPAYGFHLAVVAAGLQAYASLMLIGQETRSETVRTTRPKGRTSSFTAVDVDPET